MLVGTLALTTAALFTGAAVYVNVAEQPARLHLDDRSLLIEWQPAYKRGALMQASLALIGFVLGLAAWWVTNRHAFLVGGLMMLAPWPWTLIAIKPTNTALMKTDIGRADAETRALVVRWGGLHAVRTALGCAATVAFIVAPSSS
jgi:hypothetical protein